MTDDLISIGTIGLIKGVDTFQPNKNVRITTYCARCIENEILMYFRKNNKYSKDISINDSLGYDKDGNSIMIQDVLKTEDVNFCEDIELKDNIKLLYKSHHSSRLSCILFLKETIEEQPNRLIIDAFPWIESRQINVSPHKWSLLHKKWEKNIKDSLKDNAF
jgi:DNA-directed RNA polymerase specialized sigma subunit